jgi:hypothetical protein
MPPNHALFRGKLQVQSSLWEGIKTFFHSQLRLTRARLYLSEGSFPVLLFFRKFSLPFVGITALGFFPLCSLVDPASQMCYEHRQIYLKAVTLQLQALTKVYHRKCSTLGRGGAQLVELPISVV